jgi:hypothetical protein
MTTDDNSVSAPPRQPSWRLLATHYAPGDVLGGVLAYFLFCHREIGPAFNWFAFMLILSMITLKIRRAWWQMRYDPADQ